MIVKERTAMIGGSARGCEPALDERATRGEKQTESMPFAGSSLGHPLYASGQNQHFFEYRHHGAEMWIQFW